MREGWQGWGMGEPIRALKVLGVPISCVTYETACEEVQRLARRDVPSAVAASNTHIVSLARHQPSFAAVLRRFALILPDGMPLIWALNWQGAELPDRVYGPYFMKVALERLGAPWRHFFFGGSEETLALLVARAREWCPGIKVVGTLSPPYRKWTEEDEAGFAKTIRESEADFIWVALGGERQERWIAENLHRYERGVFFAVGDAFELLAGRRPFAPRWMQRSSLTWLYRLAQEPGRLWPRYLKFNSLFLYYICRDAVLGMPKAESVEGAGEKAIVFVGSRGVPARYSGFEKAVEGIGSNLVKRGWEVTVFNRPHFYPDRPESYLGMELAYLPTVRSKSLETIVHTALSLVVLWFRKREVVYLCGVGNAPLAFLVLVAGRRMVINVDGADYMRRKWGLTARLWLKFSERWAVFWKYPLVADNREIVQRYERDYGYSPTYIPYGVEPVKKKVEVGEGERWGVESRGYLLFVSRLTPENEAEMLLRAHAKMKNRFPLVVVGDAGYEVAYEGWLKSLAAPEVIFTGGIYGPGYVELSQKALAFVLPSAIEATRLVLLDQMSFGSAIVYQDVPATREVIGAAGIPFSGNDLVGALARVLDEVVADPEGCRVAGQQAQERVEQVFGWGPVMDAYERLLGTGEGMKGER